ncbi:MarR family winged helix-turn-helix transcriptional regulator [Wenjunlia tyrosinilytica]|uniref:HTH marR-type domain-containing protein n=1 Tax=Wenjunlia tyrosinilytica TaxID=1544741 RepID=A0A918DXU4_9ACTN|nr:MarR family transcriptional regulator [Wenjunlia tyrosinilytica]GGO87463.1 hypothetical protein GCM10012280_25970 [Wenjunlia tyrosinilytica]
MSPSAPSPRADEAARAVGSVVELLEVLWERGRDVDSKPVSASQLRAMFVLEDKEGINLRALAEALGSTPPSVSRLCDRLQAVGYIERAPSASSRRELELRLNDRGRTFLRDLRRRRETELRSVIAAMPSNRRAALVEGLESFRAAATAAADEAAAATSGGAPGAVDEPARTA